MLLSLLTQNSYNIHSYDVALETSDRTWQLKDAPACSDQSEQKCQLTWNMTTRNLFFFIISSCLVSTLLT